jgi:hypothetical protein
MIRLALTIFVLALLACGGSDTAQTDTATSAAAPEAAEAATPSGAEAAAPAAPANPQAASCLALVSQAKFSDAVPVCMAALKIDPDNAAVQGALHTAKAESASTAASGAADAAAAGANSALGDATGGALGGAAPE